jgi:hypothetical protein
MVQAIKGTEAECEVWVNETVKRDVQIASLTAEVERLRAALHFVLSWAGPIAGDGSNLTEYEIWEELHSIELARAALQPKEGEG